MRYELSQSLRLSLKGLPFTRAVNSTINDIHKMD